VTIAADETPRTPTGAGFGDAITYAWGDIDAQRFGVARVELAPNADGGARDHAAEASGYALLFAGQAPVSARATRGLPLQRPERWDAVEVAGLSTQEHVALQRWDVRFAGEDGASGFALRFEALSPPATATPEAPAAVAGGTQGYEQLCRVSGFATVDGEAVAVDCLGQRGHTWGTPEVERIELTRCVSAWLDPELAVAVTAARPRRAKSHADEIVAGSLFASLDEDETVEAIAVDETRLSTTTDAEGRVRRAGIELFLDEDDPGHRAAGAVLCGTTLDLGRLRLECSFLAWRMEGRTGVGRYEVLRHTP
jgi:hypothetical protein